VIIKKKRIVNLESTLGFVKEGTTVAIGIKDPERYSGILEKVGFAMPLNVGDSLLPPASIGPTSKFNAEGKYIIHKDQPKEIAYRVVEWHWQEYDGRYDTVEQSRLVDVPYKRYPRTFIRPHGVETTVSKTLKGNFVLMSPFIQYTEANKELLKHTLNLFLEIFGECQVFMEDLNEVIKPPIRRLNWKILPTGRMPWEQLRQELEPIIKSAPEGNRPFILHRLETINSFNPDFTAVGKAGFNGYVIMGFPNKNIYVCESIFYGNATYIFAERWEELSKKTKAEMLDDNLQEERIIHRVERWDRRIRELLT
jgi:hypothetical protein